MLEKKTIMEIKNAFICYWAILSKEPMSLKICQQKFPILKCKNKKNEKIRTKYPITVRKFQQYNICIIRIPEKEDRNNKAQEIFGGMMDENLPKLMRHTKPQIQESKRTQSRINTKKMYTIRHIMFKFQITRDKEKNMENSHRKKIHLNYGETNIRIIMDFLSVTILPR